MEARIRLYRVLFIILIGLNAFDVLGTYTFLALGGEEGNPVMRFAIDVAGISGIIATKMVLLTFFGFWMSKETVEVRIIIITVVNILFAALVIYISFYIRYLLYL